MLTRDDRTVEDCLEVLDAIDGLGLRHLGFKGAGVETRTLAALDERIKRAGADPLGHRPPGRGARHARGMAERLRRDSGNGQIGCMKTTIDIPDNELKDAMRFTGATTKREAVVTALRDFNRRRRIAALATHFGTSDTFMTHAELLKLRQAE